MTAMGNTLLKNYTLLFAGDTLRCPRVASADTPCQPGIFVCVGFVPSPGNHQQLRADFDGTE